MRRAGALAAVLGAVCVAPAAAQTPPPPAPAVSISLSEIQGDHLWTGEPAFVEGTAKLPDGKPAAGRTLIVEARRADTDDAYQEMDRLEVEADGKFSVSFKPQRNLEARLRPDVGEPSTSFSLRSFHRSLRGSLKRLKRGRDRVVEVSAVPRGYKLVRAWLYFCRPKAKRCTYAVRGKATIKNERMTTTAVLPVPKRYRNRSYRVIFRYVPAAGWGDVLPSERTRPAKTITNVDQSGDSG